MSSVHKEKIGKYIIKIYPDSSPHDPREDDNLGTMVCFHPRYTLGDKNTYRKSDYDSWDELKKAIIKNENVGVILPLYLFDHSGITINTIGFSCPWDTSFIGFIYISKKKMLENYGGKIVTQKLKDRVAGYLVNEVEEYDKYLTGDAYGYKVFVKEEGKKKEELDSCWGYFGEDECLSEAKSIVEHYLKLDTPEEDEAYYSNLLYGVDNNQ